MLGMAAKVVISVRFGVYSSPNPKLPGPAVDDEFPEIILTSRPAKKVNVRDRLKIRVEEDAATFASVQRQHVYVGMAGSASSRAMANSS